MHDPSRQPWLLRALLVGLVYVPIGIGSAAFAGAAPSLQLRFAWRLSAFGLSALAVAAHVVYEYFLHHSTAWLAAWHASVAGAFGGFGLALLANIHDLGSASGYRPRMVVALVAWPPLTGVPALVVALMVAAVLEANGRAPKWQRCFFQTRISTNSARSWWSCSLRGSSHHDCSRAAEPPSRSA